MVSVAELKKGFSPSEPNANLIYRGGPVVSNVEVTPIYFKNFDYKKEMDEFYKAIVDSSYMDWLSEYNTPKQKIGRGTVLKSIVVDLKKKDLTPNDLEDLFEDLLSKQLVKPNPNSYYPIYFEEGVTLTDLHQTRFVMCKDYCAYHTHYNTKSKYVILYGVIPYLGEPGCAKGCGQYNILGNTMSASSHEMVETVTDPINDSGWYDKTLNSKGKPYEEISDICNLKQDTFDKDGGTYIVQLQWSNKEKRCRK
ncbi:hypothetical protein HDV06_003947 [Boothiomyces sp. JEL0866]|nr:hypothetical protein HDV06_003947 [Boothiomyces sp. JEL0866]